MHPIAFHFGKITVYWYGILVATGFIVGLITASRRGLRDGLSRDGVLDSGFWILIGTVIGARALHVISYWKEQFSDQPLSEIFMVQKGGLVYYGGLIGGSLATILYCRYRKIPLWKLADALAPSIALGYFFGRFGCLMTGCCFGTECHAPWAIQFPEGHATHPAGQPAMPVHPTQIYEALTNFGLYLFLAWFYRRKSFDGQVFALYLMCYAVLRSVVELFRGDYKPEEFLLRLSPGQLLSVFILAAGALIWLLFSRAGRRPATPGG